MNLIEINNSEGKSDLFARLPKSTGVYIFRNKRKKPLYVGKSVNLRSRVGSYFSGGAIYKTKKMLEEARYLSFIQVESEFAALLLEASLVKKYLPKYNSQLRDDKSPLYIGVTKEVYPRILGLRQTQLESTTFKRVYGPFVDSRSVKFVLRKLRRVFPFSQHKVGKKACINSQIGLCNPCPSAIEKEKDKNIKIILKAEYLRNIKNIEGLLSGKPKKIKRDLDKEIKILSKNAKFEEAREKLNQVKILEALVASPVNQNLYLANPNLLSDIREEETQELLRILSNFFKIKRLRRIECYDVAHLAGTYPTASMVTFINGESDTRLYRHFRLRRAKKSDDISSMEEVVERRMGHPDWGMPDLILVDGGKGQLGAILPVLNEKVPAVGLAKRYETLVIKTGAEFKSIRLPEGPAKKLLQRIRDESHRFARRYHHKLVRKAILLTTDR